MFLAKFWHSFDTTVLKGCPSPAGEQRSPVISDETKPLWGVRAVLFLSGTVCCKLVLYCTGDVQAAAVTSVHNRTFEFVLSFREHIF